ncbi:MAG: hypothetical protein FD167_4122, partial [bacterium]
EGSPEFVDAYLRALKWSEQFPKTHSHIDKWINCVVEDVKYTGSIEAAATNESGTRTAFIASDVFAALQYTQYTKDDLSIRLLGLLAHEDGWIEYFNTTIVRIFPRGEYIFPREGYIKATEREVEALEEMGAKEDFIESNRIEIRDCIARVHFLCK